MKKVLVVILVLFILAGLGAGGYFGYTKVVKPMLDEKNVQDEEQVNALGDLLDQGSNETEDVLFDVGLFDNEELEDKPMSAPTTDIPLSDDASMDECIVYINSLSDDELNELRFLINSEFTKFDEYQKLAMSDFGDLELIALMSSDIELFSIYNDEMLLKTIKRVFGDDSSEKKIDVIKGAINRYNSSEIRQKFEYFGIQNGEVVALKPALSRSLCVFYVDKDFDSGFLWYNGFPAYPLMSLKSDGTLEDYSEYIDDIVPLIKSLIDKCEQESRYRLYRSLLVADDKIRGNKIAYYGESIDAESMNDGDILSGDSEIEQETSESKSIGETLEESGQL